MSAPGRAPFTTQFCQQAGCDLAAVRFVRRGEAMVDLCLCTGHAREFHYLSDLAARRVSEARQPRRVGPVASAWRAA